MTARETALKQLSIRAPIEIVDASVSTCHVTPPYDQGPPASYGYSPSPSPERRATRLHAEELFQLRAQWRAMEHFQKVRPDELEQVGTANEFFFPKRDPC